MAFCLSEVTKYFIRILIYFLEQAHLMRWKMDIESHARGPRILSASSVSLAYLHPWKY